MKMGQLLCSSTSAELRSPPQQAEMGWPKPMLLGTYRGMRGQLLNSILPRDSKTSRSFRKTIRDLELASWAVPCPLDVWASPSQ